VNTKQLHEATQLVVFWFIVGYQEYSLLDNHIKK
jgi:hypothetical protein